MGKYFTLLVFLLVPAVVMAQEPREGGNEKFNPEMHKQKQHAFMAAMAEFTKEDSAKFFAIYDEMRVKERELYGDSREMRNKRPETEAECRAAMIHVDSLELASKQLQYDYHMRLLDAISPKKAVRAIMAGEEFDRMAFRDMMRDWNRGNRPADLKGVKGNAGKNKGNKKFRKGNAGLKHDFAEPHPEGHRPGFMGGHPEEPGMGAPVPESPRPDGPAPEAVDEKEAK